MRSVLLFPPGPCSIFLFCKWTVNCLQFTISCLQFFCYQAIILKYLFRCAFFLGIKTPWGFIVRRGSWIDDRWVFSLVDSEVIDNSDFVVIDNCDFGDIDNFDAAVDAWWRVLPFYWVSFCMVRSCCVLRVSKLFCTALKNKRKRSFLWLASGTKQSHFSQKPKKLD